MFLGKIHAFICFIITSSAGISQPVIKADVCVYGGTSAGVIAAYTVKKSGKSVVMIEPGKHVGGLTTGGLGYTDIGNKYAVTGLSLNFYRNLGKHYGKFESWIFEPHVAEQIFQKYITSARIQVLYQNRLHAVQKDNGKINFIALENNRGKPSYRVYAKMFIDCSYEGDLIARSGVSYTIGREDNSVWHETYNGVQLRDKHQFPDGVDPYKIPGNAKSGLLWGISSDTLLPQGAGDKKVQAYNFRICLTDSSDNSIPVTRPANYDSSVYELLLRLLSKKPAKRLEEILNFNLLPNRKTDINNNGAFSTDMIGMNYNYPQADFNSRKRFVKELEDYTKGLLYFIGHDNRMPGHLRQEMLKWGYPKDEYRDNNNWSGQMYVREARRMISDYVMKQANCEGKTVVNDGIGMAAYTMDSHNCERLVVNGMVKNEGDVQIGGFGPYPISYRSIVPKANECKNLLVPVCLSASHIAYGSIRMEPVFMVLAQSAAVAAIEAIQSKSGIQHIDVKKVQAILKNNPLADGSTAEIAVDNDDKEHAVVQGEWTAQQHGGYGPSLLFSREKTDNKKWVKFIPEIKKSGYYNVYSYFIPGFKNAASATSFTIHNKNEEKEIVIPNPGIQAEGQTSGEWIFLGRFYLEKGSGNYVKISGKDADGSVVADAVLFKPDFDK